MFKRSLEIKIYCPIVIIKRILKYNVEIVKLSCIITGVSFDFLTSLGFKNIIHCSREREREPYSIEKQLMWINKIVATTLHITSHYNYTDMKGCLHL